MTLVEAAAALEAAADERFRWTWIRHGAPAPVFGVPCAALSARIGGIEQGIARRRRTTRATA
jgi:hypothetical protein